MMDKRNEEYIKPKESVKAFSGEGHKLGRYEHFVSTVVLLLH
jgi:hypothetical protein